MSGAPTDEERLWAAEKQSFVAEARDGSTDEREAAADAHEALVDAREAQLTSSPGGWRPARWRSGTRRRPPTSSCWMGPMSAPELAPNVGPPGPSVRRPVACAGRSPRTWSSR